jgi:hypothetical protein
LSIPLTFQEEGRDPVSCHRTAKTWFDFTEFSYLFIIVKCVATIGYVIKVASHPWIVVLMAVTLPECIFKLYMLWVVYDFMRDLRRSLKYLPKFHFIPLSSGYTRTHSNSNNNNNDESKGQGNGDINCNMQFLV